MRMMRNHGIDKILFATDSPWGGQKEFVEMLYKLPFTKEEREKIAYKNASALLKK